LLGQLGVKNVSLPVHLLQVVELAHQLGEVRVVPGGVLLRCFVQDPTSWDDGEGAPEPGLCGRQRQRVSPSGSSVTNPHPLPSSRRLWARRVPGESALVADRRAIERRRCSRDGRPHDC
jgi:hypothetical protein